MIPEKYRGRFHEFRRMSGIYKITNTVTGNCYIGKSIDIMKRFDTHYQEINKGYRGNKKWAEDIELYGKDVFDYEVLEEIPWNEAITLGKRERWWFSYYKPQYNKELPQIPYPTGWHVVPIEPKWVVTHRGTGYKSFHIARSGDVAWRKARELFQKNRDIGAPMHYELLKE
jgi:hypothetical protein